MTELLAILWRIYQLTRWRWLGDFVALFTPKVDDNSLKNEVEVENDRPTVSISFLKADPLPPAAVQAVLVKQSVDAAVADYQAEHHHDAIFEAKATLGETTASGLQSYTVELK